MRRSSIGRNSVLATLLALAPLFAAAPADAAIKSVFSEAIRGGVSTDSWAEESTPSAFVDGQLTVQIPRGATVRQAWLVSGVVHYSTNAPVVNMVAGPAATPRGVDQWGKPYAKARRGDRRQWSPFWKLYDRCHCHHQGPRRDGQ